MDDGGGGGGEQFLARDQLDFCDEAIRLFVLPFRCALANVCLTLESNSETECGRVSAIELFRLTLERHRIGCGVECGGVNGGIRCKFDWANGWNQSIVCIQ